MCTDIKENDNFHWFDYRTTEKVYKEFMLYAIEKRRKDCLEKRELLKMQLMGFVP